MIVLQIQGMSCGNCVKSVTAALSGVAGVQQVVEVDLQSGRARVQGEVDASDLIAALDGVGFEANVVEPTP